MEKEEETLKEKELKELEHRYFMLQMADTWDRSDYRFAERLREKIRKLREEIKGQNKDNNSNNG